MRRSRDDSVTNVGRAQRLADAPCDGVWGAQRRTLALTELRVPFSVGLDELHDLDRGARDIDLGSLDDAARRLATAENSIVFHGWESVSVVGIVQAA